jgi:PEP-CTERM motif
MHTTEFLQGVSPMYKIKSAIAAGMVTLVASFGSAFASPIIARDDPALVGATVIDFNAEAEAEFTSLTVASFVTFTGVNPLYVESTFADQYGMTGNYLSNQFNGGAFTISFAKPVSAFGFNWGAADQPWTMSLFGANNALLETIDIAAQIDPYAGLIGGLNLSGITSVVFTDQSSYGFDYILLDNLQYVQASVVDVPEPSSLLLLSLGLIGFVAARRRQQ